MTITALQNVWQTILGFNLSTSNKRWIADHLYEQVREEESLKPYTMEEIDARLDESERDIEEGRYYTTEEVFHPQYAVAV